MLKKYRKLSINITAISVVMSLLLTMIPVGATENSNKNKNQTPSKSANGIVREIEEYRSEYAKVFEKKDGTLVSVITADAQNFQDKKGKWQEIDNTLEAQTESGKRVLKNKANDFTVKLPESIESNNSVSISKGDKAISFKLIDNIRKTRSKIHNRKLPKLDEKNRNAHNLAKNENDTARVEYIDIIPETDIKDDVQPNGLKESIIIKKTPQVITSYTYEITAKGLSAKLNQDKSIDFYAPKSKNPCFSMPSPFMFDSSKEQSTSKEVEVTLTEKGSGVYLMTYTPKLEWLQDKSRKYPIILDPTIEVVAKNYLSSTYAKVTSPNSNFYMSDILPVGENSNSYISYDIQSIAGEFINNYVAPNTRITKALLHMNTLENVGETKVVAHGFSQNRGGSSSPNPYASISGMTWNNRPSSSIMNDIITVKEAGDVSFDVTKSVSFDTDSGGRSGIFRGICLYSLGNSSSTSLVFASTKHEEIEKRPYLELEFTSPSEVDFERHEIDMNRAGTAYINDVTGALTIQREDMGFDGNVLPVNICSTLDFNSDFYKPFDYLGPLQYVETYGEYENFYQLIDEDGEMHYLKKSENTEEEQGGSTEAQKEVWEDDSGYKITFIDPAISKSNYENIQLETPDGQIVSFITMQDNVYYGYDVGCISKISDTSLPQNTAINFAWNNNTYLLEEITDGAGRKYGFDYDDDRLTSIKYYGKGSTVLKEVEYEYHENSDFYGAFLLKSVTYPDGEKVEYTAEYDGNGDIAYTVKNVNNTSVKFTLSRNNYAWVPMVAKIEEIAKDGTTKGDEVDISYDILTTTFTDARGRQEIQEFDIWGNCTSVRDENGTAIFMNYDKKRQFLGSSELQVPGENNLISNWKFENNTVGWSGQGTHTRTNINDLTGFPNALKISNPTEECHAKYLVNINGEKGDLFTYGGWGKSETALPFGEKNNRTFGVSVKEYINNEWKEIDSLSFNSYFSGWQYQKSSFTLENDTSAIEIHISYDNNYGDAFFTGVELQKQLLYHYTSENYDDGYGDYIVKNNGKKPESEEKSIIYADRSKTETDEKGQITESISSAGVGERYEYDEFGNQTLLAKSNGRVEIQNKSKYTADGNYLESETNEFGKEIAYNYNINTGILNNVTTPNNVTTEFEYDALLRKTQSRIVTGGKTYKNDYTYNGDLLAKITHNNFDYLFGYDKWNNLSTVKVGTQNLVTNEYSYTNSNTPVNNAKRLLEKMVYGNGQWLQYIYDNGNNNGKKDLLTGIKFSGDASDRFSYTYNNKNELISTFDRINNTTIKTNDDGLTEKFIGINTNGTPKHSYVMQDDEFIEKIGTKALKTKYKSDNDGRPLSTSYKVGNKNIATENRYDDLNRTTNVGLGVTNDQGTPEKSDDTYKQVFWTNYLYRELPNFKSSNQVYSVDYIFGKKDTEHNNILGYSYDNMGNITAVSKDNDSKQNYQYDGLGQIVREDDKVANKSYTYTYDNGGNITSKKEYAYTTGTLGAVTATIPYVYGDNNWKDKLTSWNNKPISYDNVGNPTSYDGYSLAWEGGRQLKSVSGAGFTLEFKYDANGIRTQKIDTTYTTIEGMVTSETTGSNTTYYRYGADGQLISLRWQDDEYFYVKNIQGDIIAIVDSNGDVVVEYTYDAWGNQTSCTGSDSSTLGAANPFRYRGYYFDVETGLYYLQSRYYNPQWGRFINADAACDTEDGVLGTNMFAYCHNNPVMFVDLTGEKYGVIVYSRRGPSDLYHFATSSYYFNYYQTKRFEVQKKKDFVKAWNSMTKVKDLFLYLHGEKGELCFSNGELNTSQLKNKLKKIKVTGYIYLFSCHGGEGADGWNVALVLSLITGRPVIACVHGVSYFKHPRTDKYRARVESPYYYMLGTYWYKFYYEYSGNKPVRAVKVKHSNTTI